MAQCTLPPLVPAAVAVGIEVGGRIEEEEAEVQ